MPKEYIEKEALKRLLIDKYNFFPVFVKNAIEEAPTADVVEVVRCKNCKAWDIEHISCEGFARCINGESGVRYRRSEDFCSYGERRTE